MRTIANLIGKIFDIFGYDTIMIFGRITDPNGGYVRSTCRINRFNKLATMDDIISICLDNPKRMNEAKETLEKLFSE